MKPVRSLSPGTTLTVLSFISVLIILFRAWNQDLTIDEANTYHFYISKLTPDFWWAGSNNHLLSSILIRGSTSIFGFSPFAMRLPAVLSGAVYVACTAVLVSLLVDRGAVWLRICLYSILVFNPFMMDYLVAARGYAPALACEMAMLLVVYQCVVNSSRGEEEPRRLIWLSILGAWGVAFNYSFLFTISSILFCTFIFIAAGSRKAQVFAWWPLLRMGARLFLPFVAIIFLLCSNNIITMPQSEISIGWGCDSLAKMFRSFSHLSFSAPNPFLTPPGLRHSLKFVMYMAPWLFLVASGLSCILLALRSWGHLLPVAARRAQMHLEKDRFVWCLLAIFALSFALHCFLFFVLGIKLPRTRTGIHLVPLMALIATAPVYLMYDQKDRFSAYFSKIFAILPGLIAVFFVFSLRFSYFQEWTWNADVCTATNVALSYADIMHTQDVKISWEYDAAGNYYGQYLGYGIKRLNNMPEDQLLAEEKINKQPAIYMLSQRAWGRIDHSGLSPVYESRLSGTIVAIQNAGGVTIPATPVHSQFDLQTPCHEHTWFDRGGDLSKGIEY